MIFLSFSIQQSNAQVVIKDKVEIKPFGQQTLAPGTESAVSGPNSFYYPVLRRVDYGKYVVVKSGELKFYFKEATSYGIENADDLVLTYSINGPNFNTQDSIKIADVLGDPITIKENADISCSETQMYFSPNLSYGVSPTDDTFIVHSEPGQTPNTQNFGDEQRLVATGHYNPSDHPDSANTSTYIKYGIGQLETNAELEEAIFSIIAEISGTKTNGNFRIYKVNGYWDEESLSYATRPATYLPATTTLTPDDILEVDGVGYDYSKGITSLVNDWINGDTDDHGIRISSDSSHYFVSKDNLFEATSQSTITLNLTNNANTQSSPVLSLGYVEAGDTLSLDYLDYDFALNHVFTTNPADAEEIVSFGERTNCQTDNGLSFYPFIEEDTTQAPYFDFVLNRDLELTDLDIDTTQYIYYQDVYIEPRIKFDNGSSPIPGFLFDFSYRMELYDVPSVALSNSSQERFVALLDGDPDGGEALYDDAGADILVLNRPETQGKKFKLRVMGEFKKGFTLGKSKPGDYDTSEVKDAVQEIFPGKAVSNIASDPYCGLTEAYVSRNGVFVNCFEFTIGSADSVSLELSDLSDVWPTIRARDGGNPNERNMETFTVTATKNGAPVPNHEIKLSTEFITNSGGHDHSDTLPPLNKLGRFENMSTGDKGEGELVTSTDENGEVVIRYTATELGGKLIISAQSVSDPSLVKDTMNVRVPNLEYLGTSDFFELVGAPQFNNTTNDPCRSEASLTSLHRKGHYGLNDINSEINKLAKSFFMGNDSTKLRINDISLSNGGIFDIDNNWMAPHSSHRVGTQFDLGIDTINKGEECVEGENAESIINEIRSSTLEIAITYNTHYHVTIN